MIRMPEDTVTDKKNKSKTAARDEFMDRPANQTVTLIKSVFTCRESFLFFPYPPFLKI